MLPNRSFIIHSIVASLFYSSLINLTIASFSTRPDLCESESHKAHLNSKLNSKTVLVLPSLEPSHIFPFHLLPSPVHALPEFPCFFSGFLAICILVSSNNNDSKVPEAGIMHWSDGGRGFICQREYLPIVSWFCTRHVNILVKRINYSMELFIVFNKLRNIYTHSCLVGFMF